MLFDDESVTDREASPVPSPAGSDEDGSNILSLTSGGVPVPLSRILIARDRQGLRGRRESGFVAVARPAPSVSSPNKNHLQSN